MELEFSGQIFEKYANTKFHDNPSAGSRVVPCGPTNMTKIIVAFRYFADMPKKFGKPHRPHYIFKDKSVTVISLFVLIRHIMHTPCGRTARFLMSIPVTYIHISGVPRGGVFNPPPPPQPPEHPPCAPQPTPTLKILKNI